MAAAVAIAAVLSMAPVVLIAAVLVRPSVVMAPPSGGPTTGCNFAALVRPTAVMASIVVIAAKFRRGCPSINKSRVMAMQVNVLTLYTYHRGGEVPSVACSLPGCCNPKAYIHCKLPARKNQPLLIRRAEVGVRSLPLACCSPNYPRPAYVGHTVLQGNVMCHAVRRITLRCRKSEVHICSTWRVTRRSRRVSFQRTRGAPAEWHGGGHVRFRGSLLQLLEAAAGSPDVGDLLASPAAQKLGQCPVW